MAAQAEKAGLDDKLARSRGENQSVLDEVASQEQRIAAQKEEVRGGGG
jgi:hypothetical protein